MKTLRLLGFVLVCLIPSLAWTIPQPEAKDKMAPKLGVYKSNFGFEILTENTNWIQTKPPKKTRFIQTVFQSPTVQNNVRASLTVRVDNMKEKTSLRNYVRRWIDEYPKYGYEVLGSKPFKNTDGQKGYVIDLRHPNKDRQLRQVIHLNKKVAVIITCRDHSASFKTSLKECNNIARNFRWN